MTSAYYIAELSQPGMIAAYLLLPSRRPSVSLDGNLLDARQKPNDADKGDDIRGSPPNRSRLTRQDITPTQSSQAALEAPTLK